MKSFALSLSFFSIVATLAGCSCSTSPGCDFPVRCVATCGGAESIACGACPAGTVPLSSCTDAAALDGAVSDAGDASTDAARDASRDATTPDADDVDAFAVDAAVVCERPGYPVDTTATREERAAVEAAATAFGTDTGVTVGLDDRTAAVASFSAPIPLPYDTSISDPCMRALDAIQHFFAAHQDFMRIPTDMAMRACDYDSLTDSDVVRIHGGSYDGRRLISVVDNDLVLHVTRSGNLRYFGGSYLPSTPRLFPSACFNPDSLAQSLVGRSLDYTRFEACIVGPAGSITITPGDTRTAGEPALYVDAAGFVHIARSVEVLLAPAHVGPEQINSDLFCCSDASLEGCVGKYVIVDEIDRSVLTEVPRCTTC